jgi:integral membrane sensor domain MASE1
MGPALIYSAQDRRRRRPLPFLPSIGIAFGLYFVLPVVLGAYNRYLLIALDPRVDYDFPVQIALCAWIAVIVSYFLAGEFWSRVRLQRRKIPWGQARIVFWGFTLLYGAFALSAFKAIFMTEGFSPAVTQFILSLQWLGIAFLTVARSRRLLRNIQLIFFAVGAATSIGLTLAGGSMAPLVQLAAVVGYALFLSGTRLKPRWLVAGLLILGVAISARGVATEFRAATWFGTDNLSAVDRAQLMVTLIQKKVDADGLGPTLVHGAKTTFERSADMDLLADVVKRTPSEIPYWEGYTYRSLIGVAIPRLLWPDKPTKEIGQAFGHRYGYLKWNNLATSINLPFLVEFYLNFGFLGVLIGMSIVGVTYRTLDEVVNHPAQDLLTSLFGVIVLVPLLMLESDFSLTFGGLLLNGLALYVVLATIRNSGRLSKRVPPVKHSALGSPETVALGRAESVPH